MRVLSTGSLGRGAWAALMAIGVVVGSTGLSSGQQDQPGGPEVLARGPLHEAFASPVVYNPMPGAVVPKPPPSEQIEEQPPDQKPEGADVEWIPGYWAWDDERNDYLWISGIWRDIPPGRQWVPGYWGQADGGFRWTPGFWSVAAASGPLSYLPPPPQSLEVGPNSPQPGAEFLWSPGTWVWYENRYLWRPGFWVQSQPQWVWVPPSYVATPGGYLYVEGYWDHPVERRGVIYAPVIFAPAYLARPAFVYTPTVSLSIGGLTANLFLRPACSTYFFGDYYGVAAVGPRPAYVPWFAYQQHRYGYDPLYATMAFNHRREPEWDRRIRTEYVYRVEHREARPAPTFAAQRAMVERRRARGEDVRGLEIAHVANRPGNLGEAPHRFEPVRNEERAEFARRQANVREVQQGRAKAEAQVRPQANLRPEERRPQFAEIPRSPVVARNQPKGGAGQPKAQDRPHPTPPANPQGHQESRPKGPGPGHQEPARQPAKAEPRHEAPPRPAHNAPKPGGQPPHQEPRAKAGAKERHQEPKHREAGHPKPKTNG